MAVVEQHVVIPSLPDLLVCTPSDLPRTDGSASDAGDTDLGSGSAAHEFPGRNNLDFAMPVEIDDPTMADVYAGVLGILADQIGVNDAPFNRDDRRSTPPGGLPEYWSLPSSG